MYQLYIGIADIGELIERAEMILRLVRAEKLKKEGIPVICYSLAL